MLCNFLFHNLLVELGRLLFVHSIIEFTLFRLNHICLFRVTSVIQTILITPLQIFTQELLVLKAGFLLLHKTLCRRLVLFLWLITIHHVHDIAEIVSMRLDYSTVATHL